MESRWTAPRLLACGKQHICPWVSASSPLSTCYFHLGVGVSQEARKGERGSGWGQNYAERPSSGVKLSRLTDSFMPQLFTQPQELAGAHSVAIISGDVLQERTPRAQGPCWTRQDSRRTSCSNPSRPLSVHGG